MRQDSAATYPNLVKGLVDIKLYKNPSLTYIGYYSANRKWQIIVDNRKQFQIVLDSYSYVT